MASTAFAGEPCEDNFSVSGNLLTGKTYRTTASIANANPRDAFDGAMSFTAGNGFTVQGSDKNAGTISAVQTSNRRVPLGILMSPDGANTKIAFSYLTPAGVHSPEDAIKKHFCNTIVAATNSARAAAAVPPPAPPAPVAHVPHTPPPRPIQRGAPVGYAAITAEQKEAIQTALMKNIPNDRIREMVKEAAPAIMLMAERAGCLASQSGNSAMMEFAAPGKTMSILGFQGAPMMTYGVQYHDKSICMNVVRITDWAAPANNALTYQIVYKADDSGESAIKQHEIIRQTDGTWLFGK